MHAPAPPDEGDLPSDRAADAPNRPDGCRRAPRAFVDWVVVVGVALFVAFVVRTFLLAHFVVEGASMTHTLHTGDRVFVNKLSYRLHDPNRGDVVVLHEVTGASERDLIKRGDRPAGRDHRDVELSGHDRRADARSSRTSIPRS